MGEIITKRSWYDGWFYKVFIDGINSKLRRQIFSIIERDKSIIDIGCGTGGLALKLAEKCKRVAGIDISERMIQTATKRKILGNFTNVDFIITDAKRISEMVEKKFDYAIFSFFIHEIDPEYRPLIIKEVKKISDKILIFDYNVPFPANLAGYAILMIEFFAGRSHFKNFKDYVKRGGMESYFNSNSWNLEYDHLNRKKIFRTMVFSSTEKKITIN